VRWSGRRLEAENPARGSPTHIFVGIIVYTEQKNSLNQYVTKPHSKIRREIADLSIRTFGTQLEEARGDGKLGGWRRATLAAPTE